VNPPRLNRIDRAGGAQQELRAGRRLVRCLRAGRPRGELVRNRLRARRPRGELVGDLAGKLAGGPAGQFAGHIADLIRSVAADAIADRRAKQRRPGVLASALGRRFGPPYLLLRNPYALDAFIAIQELREIFGLIGVDPDDDPGFSPWLFERVADVAHYRLPGRDRESVQRAPLFPCRFQARRGALSTCDQFWITHRAILP